MDYMEVVHILQAVRNVSQLNSTSVVSLRCQVITHKLNAVCVPVPLDEFIDVSVFHPLGNQNKSVFVQRHPKQR